MYEMILYAIIATIVCAMLYKVLGQSVGQGSENRLDAKEVFRFDSQAEKQADNETTSQLWSELQKLDTAFSPKEFLENAKIAYGLILDAFANGDRETLKGLLTDEVYQTYVSEIEKREAENLTQITDLGNLKTADIVEVQVQPLSRGKGHEAEITVRFEAEISAALIDEQGQTQRGDRDTLSHIFENWTFVRHLNRNDPTWRLSMVAENEGESLSVDPSPDTP